MPETEPHITTPLQERLRRARKRAGLTQAEVAKQANTHRTTVAQIELGERHIPRKEAALARALGVRTSIDELFELGESP